MPNDDYRAEQAERRQHGLEARHEHRLENATYTAAEVKVLTEEACKVAAEAGRRIGRREAGEEIAQAIRLRSKSDVFGPIAKGTFILAAGIAREIGSKEASA